MHNSLFTRDELRRANANPVYTRFRDPYRALTIQPHAAPAEGEFALANSWRLDIDEAVNPETRHVLENDLRALWQRLGLQFTSNSAEARVRLCLSKDLGNRDCRLEFAPGDLILSGGGIAGLWAAVSWLVWELRVRRKRALPLGRREYRAAWDVQISQGPWGGNYSVPDFGPEFLSDESFRLFAHSGVNSMMLYGDLLCYVQSAVLPELNHVDADQNLEILREAGARAARYGVGFTYVPVHPKLRMDHPVFRAHPEVQGRGYRFDTNEFSILCSSSPASLAFYDEQYGRLFRAVPQLQGVLSITYSESFYHCDMWRQRESRKCPQCESIPRDQRVIGLLRTVADAVQSAQPGAFLSEWIYTWGKWDNGQRSLAQIHATRPPQVGVCQAVDKDPLYDGKTVYAKPGYRKTIWDYSAEYEGPTAYSREAADFARSQNRFFVAKTETGTGLETMQLPYVPALHHFARKWQGVRSLRPNGVHQAWLFYGHHGSRAEQLAAWAAYRSDLPANEYLKALACADFGPKAAPAVLAGWARFGRALKHLPCLHLGDYYRSPSFLGPCHPLLPDAVAPVPEAFYAFLYYLQENGPSFSGKDLADCRVDLVMAKLPDSPSALNIELDPGLGWDLVADEYAIAAAEGKKGWEALRSSESSLESDADRLHWLEEEALAELTWRTFLTCEHVVRFLVARKASLGTGTEKSAANEMRRVAALERENTRAAVDIFARAPWLDPKARLDGVFPAASELIAEKLKILNRFLES
ncbi:MAG: hypothetical protein HY291_12435 [Planctomycetes bacterium]|nr:hypothetical protein [Planctomycetota bacterium]